MVSLAGASGCLCSATLQSWGKYLLGAFLAGLVLTAAAQAASPREELLRLVPEEVGFCLVVQDVRAHSQAFLHSPFYKQFLASPMGQAFAKAPEQRKLAAVDEDLQKYLQVSWAQVRDDLLGDAVVFAYRPGPPGQPEQEQGVMLLRARDAHLLNQVLKRWNEVQKRSGDLQDLQKLTYQGAEYTRRVEHGKIQFYYLDGPVLVFTSQEAMLRAVIDLDRGVAGHRPVAARGGWGLLNGEGGLAALWINPRAFEPELKQRAARAQGPQAVALKTLLTYWSALEGITLSAALPKTGLTLELTFQAQEERLPPAARRLFTEPRASELWSSIPENSLLAVAGRLDAVGLSDMVADFLAPNVRKTMAEAANRRLGAILGKDVVKEVLPALGPDWGFYLTAPPPGDKTWLPQGVWALHLRSAGKGSSLDRSLIDGLNLLATLAVLGYNKDHADQMSLQRQDQDNIEVRYLADDDRFPPSFQPAFALKGGYLVLASSPEAIRRFSPSASAAPMVTSRGDIPLLRLSCRELAGYLKDPDRREALVLWLAGKDQMPQETVRQGLEQFLLNVQLFDSVELTQRPAPGRFALTLRVNTAQAARGE